MVLGHVHVAVVMQVIGGEIHLPGDGCAEHVGLVICCVGKGLHKAVQVRSNWLMGKHLICLLLGIFDCFIARCLITAPV